MNQKNIILLVSAAFFITLLISGCTSHEQEETSDQTAEDTDHENHTEAGEDEQLNHSLIPIEAAIFTQPEELSTNTTSQLLVQVTQGEEFVNDADEVVFEFWRHGDEEHQIMEGILQGDGLYAIEYTFLEEGIYYVVPHVTARHMHVMPYKRFIVGDVTDEEIRAHEEEQEDLQNSQHMH